MISKDDQMAHLLPRAMLFYWFQDTLSPAHFNVSGIGGILELELEAFLLFESLGHGALYNRWLLRFYKT